MKILIVDDNEDILELLQTVMTAMGHQVDVSNGGIEGLNKIQTGTYDAILLDIAMPDFSGIDVINQLEKEKTIENKNIFVFTASAVKEDEISVLLKKGIKGIIRKPITVEKLEQKLREFIKT